MLRGVILPGGKYQNVAVCNIFFLQKKIQTLLQSAGTRFCSVKSLHIFLSYFGGPKIKSAKAGTNSMPRPSERMCIRTTTACPCESQPHKGHFTSKLNSKTVPVLPSLIFLFQLLSSPVYLAEFSFYIFPSRIFLP